MLGGALIVGACLTSVMAAEESPREADVTSAEEGMSGAVVPTFAFVDSRVACARRALESGEGVSGPALAVLGLLSPAAVEAIETLGSVDPF